MKHYLGDRTIDGVKVTVDGAPLDPRVDVMEFTKNGIVPLCCMHRYRREFEADRRAGADDQRRFAALKQGKAIRSVITFD
jgi:hypothetical protein